MKFFSSYHHYFSPSHSRFLRIILSCLLSFLFALSTPLSLFALTDENLLDFYDNNHIYYYNPNSNTNSSCSELLGDYDGIPTAGLSPLQAAFVDKYHAIAESLGREYGIPWETPLAQGILESAAGTSRFARERNNFFGIGAFDRNPNLAKSYASPTAGWRGYFDNIKRTKVYRAHGAFDHPNDPYQYALAIKQAGYATDPGYVKKLSKLIKAIEKRAETKNWPLSRHSGSTPSSDPSSTSTSVSTSSDCQNFNSSNLSSSQSTPIPANNFDINATALALSWPDRSHSPDDPKASYRQALNLTGINRLGDHCSMSGKSCDAFVATVLRYSGADPKAHCCGAFAMQIYFNTHPNLYERIPNLGNTTNLRPGDIRVRLSHIELIVQKPGETKFRIASASHCHRTGDHGAPFYPDSRYQIFRRKPYQPNKNSKED